MCSPSPHRISLPIHIRTAFGELKATLSTFSRASSAGLSRWLLVLPGMLLCLGLTLTYGLQHAAREALAAQG